MTEEIEEKEWVHTLTDCIRTLIYEARGSIARTDKNEMAHSIHLVQFPIGTAFSKLGMSDGKDFDQINSS
jgi:hypothetical protein